MACGPNRTRDGHSSGTPVTRRLQQPTRTAGSGHRPRSSRHLRAKSFAPSLFGLAPGGVCRAACVTARAVRSYRTVSPLPTPSHSLLRKRGRVEWGTGGLFSVALSLGSHPPDVIRHRLSTEPGLSSPPPPYLPRKRGRKVGSERPSDRLTWKGMGSAAVAVKGR